MIGRSKIVATAAAVGFAMVFAFHFATRSARADDAVFPPGSRIGLVPPAGMVPSPTFRGFEDTDKNAAILISALPAAAYPEMEKAIVADALKKQGVTVEKREPIELKAGKGFLVIGTQVADKAHFRKWLLVMAVGDLTALVNVQVAEPGTAYPDSVVRAALATLTVRASVPDDEQLGLLPFKVGDLAGFHIDGVLPGRALLLRDASKDGSKGSSSDVPADTSKDKDAAATTSKDAPGGRYETRMLVAALPGGPAESEDRGNFARVAFDDIGGIKDVQISMSEPLRIGGQTGFQTVAQAKDTRTDASVMVVQWLRFGSGGFIQMIGISPSDQWTDMLTRLRAVRDSIDPK